MKEKFWWFAESLSALIWVVAIVVGTYAEFFVPRGGPKPNGCYFTDALIVFIECSNTWANHFLGQIFSWSWSWTWGIKWMLGFFPYSLPVLVPEIVTLFLAFRFLQRLVGHR